MKKLVKVLSCAMLGLSLTACSSKEEESVTLEPVTLTVAAAASLEKAFEEELIPMFTEDHPNVTIEGVYDSSGKLQIQIEQGLEADIFFSAATKQMKALSDEGYIDTDTTVNLLENKLVLVKQKGAETKVKGFANVNDATIVAIGDPEVVPAGQYAKEALTNVNVWDSIQDKVSLGGNVTEVLAWVENGSAEVGIVYASDAAKSNHVEIIEECDASLLETPVLYPVAALKETKNSDETKQFLEFLQSEDAIKVFEKLGFSSYK